jgi:hypothetical protein
MKYDGSSWVNVGSPGFSAGKADYISIAIDATGTPYVVYKDFGNSSKATVMKYDGSSWVNVGSPGFSAGKADTTSIAIDATGTPYVAYQDYTKYYRVTVKKYNGAEWEDVGSPGFSAGAAYYISIAIDATGTPYVVYRDHGNSTRATVKKYNGAEWEDVGSPGFSAGRADYISIAIDSSGTPYVAYKDFGNSNKATVMKYDGSSWVSVGSPGFSTNGANYTSIAFDPFGTLYIVHNNIEYSQRAQKATVMKYNGAEWEDVGSADFPDGDVAFTSIAIDSSGTPYVVYRNGGSGYKATVMKYTSETLWRPSSYEIDSIQDLYNTRNDLFGNYSLTKDLDFNDINSYDETIPAGYSSVDDFKTKMTSNEGFLPIGTNNDLFSGSFNGTHKISNLFINRSSTDYIGLFGGISSMSNLTNIFLENVNVTGGGLYWWTSGKK